MKNKNLAIYLLIISILILSTESCTVIMKTFHPFNSENNCPTNNPNYFYKQNGAKPTKAYTRNIKFSQRRYRY